MHLYRSNLVNRHTSPCGHHDYRIKRSEGGRTPAAKRTSETGRSMVEMLGVLAVIGVLSVAGIAGYTSAMNRYRANELLNEASKRASVIAGQINMFGYTPSLAEFTTNAWGYGAFENTVYGADGTAAWTKTDKQFTLSLTGISEGVCQHMQQVVSLPIKGFQPETCAEGDANIVKLTYNNDMSREDIKPPKPTYDSCVAEGRCTYDGGRYHCLNGAANPPHCTDDCQYGCGKEEYTCWGIENCSCRYGGTYPNCDVKPDCIDDGFCSCTQVGFIRWNCGCSYGVGTYPDCSKPACIDDGTCSCSNGSCSCSYGVGTYPNCSKPACIDDRTCACYNGSCSCNCGGTYPDNCDKPSCLDNGTCLCGYGEHYCVNGGTYPDNCNDKPACFDDRTCYCQMVSGLGFLPCMCSNGGSYPNCDPLP